MNKRDPFLRWLITSYLQERREYEDGDVFAAFRERLYGRVLCLEQALDIYLREEDDEEDS